jgi:hypothetical protein
MLGSQEVKDVKDENLEDGEAEDGIGGETRIEIARCRISIEQPA